MPELLARHAEVAEVRARSRQRVQDERAPGGRGDDDDCADLPAPTPVGQQEDEYVTESDLREDVMEGELRAGAVAGRQEDGQRDQQGSAADGVEQRPAVALAGAAAAREGVGDRDADHEHEGGLDQVPGTATQPGGVRRVGLEERPERGVRVLGGDRGKAQPARRHEEHGQAS